ncbi:MAG: RlpA-like double-psi beta-barrel domain-containing protein [Actinomycetota bacterium]
MAVLAYLVAPAPAASGQSGDLESIRNRLQNAQNQTSKVLGELKSIDSRIYSVGNTIAQDEAEVATLRERINLAEGHVAELESQMTQVRKASNDRARRMYMNGPANILSVLFNATSFGDLPRVRVFFESLAEEDGATIIEANRLKEDLEIEKAELAGAVQELRGRVERLDAERADLQDTRQQRASSLAQLKEAIEQAQEAEQAVLAARAAAVKEPEPSGSCTPGIAARDQKLAALLNWYSPATGGSGLMPDKLSPSGVVTSGEASWYGPGFDGCRSASGATFYEAQMTAASLSLPMGTLLKVTHGGKAVVVVITDRGPYAHGRVLDLSRAAAEALGLSVGHVEMEILLPTEPAPPFP